MDAENRNIDIDAPKKESLSNGFTWQMPVQSSGRQGKGDKGTHEAQDTTCHHMGKQTKA